MLVNKIRLDTNGCQFFFKSHDAKSRVAFRNSARIWHATNRPAQMRGEHLLLRQVFWNFSESIEVVPTVNKSDFTAQSPQGTRHKVNGNHLAEIADMHGATGRDATGHRVGISRPPK